MNDSATNIARFSAFAQQAAVSLAKNGRVRTVWLTGSVPRGAADSESDVDFRVAVADEEFQRIGDWWSELADCMGRALWKRRVPSPPDEACGLAYPDEFEAATRRHLREKVGIDLAGEWNDLADARRRV